MTNWNEIDAKVKQWLQEAGDNIRKSFTETLDIQTKSNPNDLVTNMDKATEQFFIEKIKQNYPDHSILGEEGFGDKLESLDGVVWIIDPIDGTMNFIYQQRHFAISIGIFENGIGRLGYIYDVAHDELYFAEKGKGAFLNGKKLKKLAPVKVEEAIIALNSTWLVQNRRMDPKPLISLAQTVRGTRSYGTAALEFAYVAAGILDGYITMRLSPWDFAAGKILVEETGGIVTNLKGEPLNLLEKNTIFVAKPGLHTEIMERFLQNV
ncbi:inositol monophosphatase family protein [Bacillus smithii]|uniref:inositol monophosphatase family protein n=1 Tax=Bacillus smithii TaxID=1479 RepID=UPI002E246FED|nr:inositol monophosphatase family protein [Bacillus smithii]MED1419555.1 inositol monophosphatase family protein [Bacillus smithii]MED1455921.1 inositol monophosphatase family protein [Bacillus smithii]